MSRDTLAERIVEFIFMDNRNIDLFCGGCPGLEECQANEFSIIQDDFNGCWRSRAIERLTDLGHEMREVLGG
ncbi:MAG: hypothetical protein M0P99_10190 [Candidatus Cloacimonetes bacterium]|jgi:hypothetical protein|nr:hypothetical protein [Candidatus Cloacimonadota bacterium]